MSEQKRRKQETREYYWLVIWFTPSGTSREVKMTSKRRPTRFARSRSRYNETSAIWNITDPQEEEKALREKLAMMLQK